jgi:DNA repair exonuclease SbcCD ATPase subunit
MKLNDLVIHNFKGLKDFALQADGHNVVVTGANGSGKTTIYDAFLWLLFGKDSTGRKDFQIRPLDKDNQPIPGLVISVTAILDIDGTQRILKKEHHENIVKKELRGYNTLCWIDDVPLKVGEYQKAVDEMIDEATFKMLTDVHQFNGKLHWTDRRKILLDIAGDIDDPKGFDALLKNLAGRSLEDYKKVLSDQKKRITEERDQIPPRIDELQRRLDTYATPSTKKNDDSLTLERSSIKAQIDTLDKKRQTLLEGERERQKQIDALNSKKADRVARERILETSTEGVQKYITEKNDICDKMNNRKRQIDEAGQAVKDQERVIANDKAELEYCTKQLTKVQAEYKEASTAAPEPIQDTCTLCGQKLPPHMQAEVEKKRQAAEEKRVAQKKEIAKRGNEIKKNVDNVKANIEKGQAKLTELKDTWEKLKAGFEESQAAAQDRLVNLDGLIASREPLPKEKDSIWLALTEEIARMEAAIGQPASQQIVALENERHDLTEKLEKINAALANRDGIKQDTARIAELGNREKELSQQLADIEKQLADIQDYSDAQSAAVEEAVNGRFKYVTFKLFNRLLNGSTEDTCEALLNGVPYADCSYGQKIRMGVDVINVLVEHTKKDCPLFIDNSESLTYPLEYEGQSICLEATETKKLKVMVK